jgi:hypothetical protein
MRSSGELFVRIHSKRVLWAFLTALAPLAAKADETPFAYTYTTDTQPKGTAEIEQWMTFEEGRPFEAWNHLAGRTELEYGLTDNLQTALMANYDWLQVHPHGPDAGDPRGDALTYTSTGTEIVWRLADPYTNPVGVALYFEPSYGSDNQEVESKLLVDSHFLDDRLIAAANLVLEYEWEKQAQDWHKGTELSLFGGLGYRFAPGWSAALEFVATREFDGVVIFQHASAAADSVTMGPTLHYAQENWWVSLGLQEQLPWAGNLSGEQFETVSGFAHEVPRTAVRLRFGVEL